MVSQTSFLFWETLSLNETEDSRWVDRCRNHYCSLTQVTTWTSSCPTLSPLTFFPGSLDTMTQRVSWQASCMLMTFCYYPGSYVRIAFRSLFDAYFLVISISFWKKQGALCTSCTHVFTAAGLVLARIPSSQFTPNNQTYWLFVQQNQMFLDFDCLLQFFDPANVLKAK